MRLRRYNVRGGARHGFTLMELMVSAALMALILTAAYQCFSAAVAAQKLMDPRLEAAQTARVVLDRMAAELRAACPLPHGSAFLGVDRKIGEAEADSLDFATHHYTPGRPGEGDFCTSRYYVEHDERTGSLTLYRERQAGIPLETRRRGAREVMVSGIRFLRIEHYDGFEWYDSWGETEGEARAEASLRDASNLSGMPDAVRLTLGVEVEPRPKREPAESNGESEAAGERGREPPMVFQTVARVMLAATRSEWSGGGAARERGGGTGAETGGDRP